MGMAKRETGNAQTIRSGHREVWGIALFAACVLLFLSLFSYDWKDIGYLMQPPNDPPANYIGPAGAWTAYALFFMVGILAYGIPVMALAFGVMLLMKREVFLRFRFFWSLMMLLALIVLVELTPNAWLWLTQGDRLNIPHAPGGVPGHYFTQRVLVHFLGALGTLILAFAVLGIASVLVFGRERIVAALACCGTALAGAWQRLTDRKAALRSASMEAEAPSVKPRYGNGLLPPEPKVRTRMPDRTEKTEEKAEKAEKPPRSGAEENPPPAPPETASPAAGSATPPPDTALAQNPPARERKAPRTRDLPASPEAPPTLAPVVSNLYPNYKLPPVDLLQHAAPGASQTLESDENVTGKVIVETLADFGIEVQVTNVERGPVVTCYELLPAPGVKVEKIAGLSNNLALSLKAKSVRVQAPIPGKGVVGVEVPNTTASVVNLRDMLEGDAWRSSRAQLPLVLGKDVGGNDLIADLATMPHLLIAGTTGSGKTVCMNSILAGLLVSRTPDQLHLMLVDPKIVEFTAYRHLPHLEGNRKEVITDPKKVAGALRWALTEMERRYKLFAKAGVRNIQGYNSRPKALQPDLFGGDKAAEARPDGHLPYLVIVVDELADLMMTAAAEVEGYITRLAQLSRATGIHMILATQRPSVNVITGTIKANFPARIAFQVAQKVDSKTILDAMGADKLLGRGDMLFMPPGASKMIRAQGCMTGDEDIRIITDFIKKQCPMPELDEENALVRPVRTGMPPPSLPAPEDGTALQSAPSPEAGAPEGAGRPRPAPAAGQASFEDMMETGGGGADENLVEQAMQVIRETRRASTSALQRRLKIGYTRAARIMDLLEERGIVGPTRGSEAREILMDLDGDMVNGSDSGEEPEG